MRIITDTLRNIILEAIDADILAEELSNYVNNNLDYEELAEDIIDAYGGVQELAKRAIIEDLPF